MTLLSPTEPRCSGARCPSAMNCRRYTERATGGEYAALYARRHAGDTACDMYSPIVPASTFEATEHHALNERTQCILSSQARPYEIICSEREHHENP